MVQNCNDFEQEAFEWLFLGGFCLLYHSGFICVQDLICPLLVAYMLHNARWKHVWWTELWLAHWLWKNLKSFLGILDCVNSKFNSIPFTRYYCPLLGGVTLLRAAGKNHARVTVICDPVDYSMYVFREYKPGLIM